MIGKTIEVISNELTERTASSRHQIKSYVFPVGKDNAQKHIMAMKTPRTEHCAFAVDN